MQKSKKIGIVLSGGGAKGAYEVGCWKALREYGINPSAVAGTSVGALNAALMAAGELEEAYRLWSHLTWKQVFSVRFKNVASLVIRIIFLLGFPYFRKATWRRFKEVRLRHWIVGGMSFPIILTFLLALNHLFAALGKSSNIEQEWLREYSGWHIYPLFFLSVLFGVLIVGVIFNLPYFGWLLCERWNLFILDNRNLESTISTFLDLKHVSDSKITTYVTVAHPVEYFDPRHPSYEALYGVWNIKHTDIFYEPCYRREYIPVYHKLNGKPAHEIKDLLLRSASLPFGIFRARSLEDMGWLDGGLADNSPINPLLSEKCDIIIIIHLDYRRDKHVMDEEYRLNVARLRRKMSVVKNSRDNYESFIAMYGHLLSSYERPTPLPPNLYQWIPSMPNVVHIIPSKPLGGLLRGTLNFSTRKAMNLIKLGYEDTIKILESNLLLAPMH